MDCESVTFSSKILQNVLRLTFFLCQLTLAILNLVIKIKTLTIVEIEKQNFNKEFISKMSTER